MLRLRASVHLLGHTWGAGSRRLTYWPGRSATGNLHTAYIAYKYIQQYATIVTVNIQFGIIKRIYVVKEQNLFHNKPEIDIEFLEELI